MNIWECLGWAGAIIVSWSNVPQMVMFIKQKHARGISLSSTWVGFIGVVLRGIYLLWKTKGDPIALGPYAFGIACILLTLYYLYFPGDKVNDENQ